jgi:hypothetical protein
MIMIQVPPPSLSQVAQAGVSLVCRAMPVLLRESKDRVVLTLAMAEEELQMPWYNHFETNHSK